MRGHLWRRFEQELELENLLRAKFSFDTIEPVPKGEVGGDALQRVVSPSGQPGGTILWESKRTKNWSDGWLVKLREDQRTANAEVAVLVTQVVGQSPCLAARCAEADHRARGG